MSFKTSETGAVTVDWVVLTAALVGLGLATMAVTSRGVQDTSEDVRASLASDGLITTSFAAFLTNGDFSQAMQGSVLPGWDYEGYYVAIFESGYGGKDMTGGSNMINMDSGASNNAISQTVQDIRDGETMTLSFDAIDGTGYMGSNSLEVWYGGELLDTISADPDTASTFTYEITGGMGDGSNLVEFRDVGPVDYHSTYLSNISVN